MDLYVKYTCISLQFIDERYKYEYTASITYRLCAAIQHRVIEFLPLLLPVLVSRLGSEEVTEPSEELRLQLLLLLSAVVKACAAGMAPYLDDMILILHRTIVDPYPELKKVSGLVHKRYIFVVYCSLSFL